MRYTFMITLIPMLACSSISNRLGGGSHATTPSVGSDASAAPASAAPASSAASEHSVAGPSGATASETQTLRSTWSVEIQPLKGALQSLDTKIGREPAKHRLIMPQDLAKQIADGEALASLAEGCKGKYKALPVRKTGQVEDPENACNLAVNWRSMFQKHLDFTAAWFTSTSSGDLKAVLDKLEKTGVIFPHDENQLANSTGRSEQWKLIVDAYAKIDAKPPDDPTGATSTLAKTYPVVLRRAASVSRWPSESTNKDKEVEAAMKKTLEAAGYKVVKTGLVTPAWEIERNELGNPIRRKRLGVISVQAKGEAFCRNYVLFTSGDHTGGGSYTATTVRFDAVQSESTITRCN